MYPRTRPERSPDRRYNRGLTIPAVVRQLCTGVDENTAVLPDGWRDRLILVTGEQTRFVRGWLPGTRALARHRMVSSRFYAIGLLHGSIRRCAYFNFRILLDEPTLFDI